MASQEQETAMYDQPSLDIFDDVDVPVEPNVEAELQGMRIKRGRSLRDYGRDVQSRAQTVMRSEMTEAKRLEAELLNAQIPQAAQAIINEYDDFTLTGAQWQVVQEMVESGIRAGLAIRAAR